MSQNKAKIRRPIGDVDILVRNDLECFLQQVPRFFDKIGIGYIGIAFSSIIIIISIFGKVKDSYKWFILNQAIWDLLVSYDFICARPFLPTNLHSCIYTSFKSFINPIIFAQAGYQLFLLSFTRFLALYFHQFYGRHSTPLKIFAVIIIYNILFVFLVNQVQLYSVLNNRAISIFVFVEYVFKLFSIIFSFVFIILILYKIFKQLRFQLQQQDRAKTIASLRIASVLLFNLITIAIFFAFTSLYEFHFTIFPLFYSLVNNVPPRFQFTETTYIIDGIKDSQTSLNVIRVILDSIAILFILSGYRKSISATFKVLIPSRSHGTTVTIVSNQRT